MENPTVMKYIKDQPRALREAFEKREVFLEELHNTVEWEKIKKIYVLGSGTSYNVSTITAYYIKTFLNINAAAYYPTFLKNHELIEPTEVFKKEEVLFIGISQSGTSTSTIAGIRFAKENGYPTIAFTEELTSEITKVADNSVSILCGKELLPPETRGYTVSVLTMYLSIIDIAVKTSKITKSDYERLIKDTEELLNYFEDILEESEEWYEKNKAKFIHSNKIILLGYGIDFGSALEGMLKIGEMYREPCIGYELEEYIHGPTMALDSKTSIIIFGSDEVEWENMLFYREKFLKHTERVSVLTYKNLESNEMDLVFKHKTNKYLAPIMFTIPTQFIAAKGASDVGIDTAINPFGESLGHL